MKSRDKSPSNDSAAPAPPSAPRRGRSSGPRMTPSSAPRSKDSRRRRVKKSSSAISAAPSAPTNCNSMLWCFFTAGLLGTILNITYVANQTALKWENTNTAEFSLNQALVVSIPKHPTVYQNDAPDLSNTNNVFSSFDGDPFKDKEHLLALLKEAGMTPIDNETAASLPTWTEITSLYGDKPVYYGLQSCDRFQGSGIASRHFLATAGTFNTGTNLLSELLMANCHMPERMKQFGPKQRGIRWQVLWGKHTPVGNETFRQTHSTYHDIPDLAADDIFAAVMTRDPYRWMQSMCRHQYAAEWLHDSSHCPSLVPNEADRRAKPHLRDMSHIPVTVTYSNFTKKHDSLVHFWNEWYEDYVQAHFPYLLIRFEDLIYHPKHVVQTVCECAGGELNKVGGFKYITNSAKKGEGSHGKDRTGYLQALSRYGRKAGRINGMDDADLKFVRKYLDPKLMDIFHYPYHDEV